MLLLRRIEYVLMIYKALLKCYNLIQLLTQHQKRHDIQVYFSQTFNAYSVQRKGYYPQVKKSFLRLNNFRSS